jgi:hypothetical protein
MNDDPGRPRRAAAGAAIESTAAPYWPRTDPVRTDVDAVYTSPRASLTGAASAARLRVSMQAGPICLIRRLLDAAVAEGLDHADPATLPTLDASGTLDRIRSEIGSVLGPPDAPAPDDGTLAPALSWLRRDVLDLAGLFAAAVGVDRLRVNLQVVTACQCPRFHVDNVGFRLLTTYRGPGTEWVSSRALGGALPGAPLPPSAIRHMDRGTVALMRGGRDATPERPGVLHRSPALKRGGPVRLLLAISDVEGGSAASRDA